MQNLRAQKLGFVLQVLWTQARPIGIGCAISPILKMWHKHHGVIMAQTCIFEKLFTRLQVSIGPIDTL